uniref:Uncharacterized protein n=1 Tax=Ananas comosus var. bracteatus TaxID=296719 RepID=A0A6V7Q1H4_ANACO|nr:unnamed protein product [Ananas comosus var. bracteatus]
MASTTTNTTTSSTSSSSSSSSTPLLSPPPPPPPPPPPSIDPKSGFCAATQTFRSLLPAPAALPPPASRSPSRPSSSPSSPPAAVFPPRPHRRRLRPSPLLPRPPLQSRSLAAALRRSISHGDVAFVLSPNRLDLPLSSSPPLPRRRLLPRQPASTPAEVGIAVRLL